MGMVTNQKMVSVLVKPSVMKVMELVMVDTVVELILLFRHTHMDQFMTPCCLEVVEEMEMVLEEMVVVFYFGISVRGWNQNFTTATVTTTIGEFSSITVSIPTMDTNSASSTSSSCCS
jgi:hypothetical protein